MAYKPNGRINDRAQIFPKCVVNAAGAPTGRLKKRIHLS